MASWRRGARWAFSNSSTFTRNNQKYSSDCFTKLFTKDCRKTDKKLLWTFQRSVSQARLSLIPTIQAATFTSASGYFSTELTASESLIEAQLLEDEILTNMIVTVQQQPVMSALQ